jgi:hypothetical protein
VGGAVSSLDPPPDEVRPEPIPVLVVVVVVSGSPSGVAVTGTVGGPPPASPVSSGAVGTLVTDGSSGRGEGDLLGRSELDAGGPPAASPLVGSGVRVPAVVGCCDSAAPAGIGRPRSVFSGDAGLTF